MDWVEEETQIDDETCKSSDRDAVVEHQPATIGKDERGPKSAQELQRREVGGLDQVSGGLGVGPLLIEISELGSAHSLACERLNYMNAPKGFLQEGEDRCDSFSNLAVRAARPPAKEHGSVGHQRGDGESGESKLHIEKEQKD